MITRQVAQPMIASARSALFLCLGLFAAQAVQAQQTCTTTPRVAPDSRYAVSEPVSGQFVVTDLETALMWKQCPEGLSGAICATGTPSELTWSAALSAASSADHAGFSDWRLPNIIELRSLVETSCSDPSINTTIFPAIGRFSWYWSASTGNSPGVAWAVPFRFAEAEPRFKAVGYRVRLVRGGQGFDTFSAEADRVPDAFTLAAQPGVALSSEQTSDLITVAGLTTVTGIAVSGASGSTYSINGGAFTTQPAAVANGDTVRVRHTSAATGLTDTTSTLTIGGETANFVSTTADVPGAPTIDTATAGDGSATVTFAAPASDGGSTITGYTATSNPDVLSSSGCTASPCTVTGLTNGIAYTFTVTATNVVGTGDPSAASNSVTPRANQTITFGAAPTVVVDGTGVLSATGGDSGNPVVFTSSTTGICTVSGTHGSTVTGVNAGICLIDANQAGSAAFNPAPQVTQDFVVGKGAQSTLEATATPASIVFGATSALSSTGGSGDGALSYVVTANTDVCSISGTTLTGEGVGSCTVTATKAGDDNYNAATATVTVEVHPDAIFKSGFE